MVFKFVIHNVHIYRLNTESNQYSHGKINRIELVILPHFIFIKLSYFTTGIKKAWSLKEPRNKVVVGFFFDLAGD